MNQGTLAERYLNQAVLKNIRKIDSKMRVGASVGIDYAVGHEIVSADGVGNSPVIAWNKAYNNFMCSAGTCRMARLTLLLPVRTRESEIKRDMEAFAKLANNNEVQIIGGHTQVSENVTEACFTVTLIGQPSKWSADKKSIKEGLQIVFVGKVAGLGTTLLLNQYEEILSERFSSSFLAGARIQEKEYSISDAITVMKEQELLDTCKICYLHDVSAGGIYTALWQMGKWIDCGFMVDHEKISVRQETIEICESLNCNPYLLDGTGGLLVLCESGALLANTLCKEGLEAQVIGTVTKQGERQVRFGNQEYRTLAPYEGDECYKAYSTERKQF